MSIIHSSRGVWGCQKGFLLLEALIGVLVLGVFFVGILGWYGHFCDLQRRQVGACGALIAGSSFLSRLSVGRQIPYAGLYKHGGHELKVQVHADRLVPSFYWVQAEASGYPVPVATGVWCG